MKNCGFVSGVIIAYLFLTTGRNAAISVLYIYIYTVYAKFDKSTIIEI